MGFTFPAKHGDIVRDGHGEQWALLDVGDGFEARSEADGTVLRAQALPDPVTLIQAVGLTWENQHNGPIPPASMRERTTAKSNAARKKRTQ